MTFDISKFSVGNSQQQSIVKEFEISETLPVSLGDITSDTINVIGLTGFMLFPISLCIWYNTNIPFMYLFIISLMVVGVMGLSRYDHNTRGLRVKTTSGRIIWEQSKSASKTSQKAEIKYIKDDYGNEVNYVNNLLKSAICNVSQLESLASGVLAVGKFNQDVVTKYAQISNSDYANLCNELLEQNVINLKGQSAKNGYTVSKRGWELFGRLAKQPTPLLGAGSVNN